MKAKMYSEEQIVGALQEADACAKVEHVCRRLGIGVRVHFIRPGKRVENAYAESFNGKLREECFNENWFVTMEDARTRIEAWRLDYNQVRPHSGLDNLTPSEFALRHNSVAADAA